MALLFARRTLPYSCSALVSASSAFGGSPFFHNGRNFPNQSINFSTKGKRDPFVSKPDTLYHERRFNEARPGVEENFFGRLALTVMGYYSRSSKMQRGADNLYQAATEQAENQLLFDTCQLPRNFISTYGLLSLHVWLILVRLKEEEKYGKDLGQFMYDNFQEDVEKRVMKEGVKVRVRKWLAELEKMFYGGAESYEKALKGEGKLSDALVRNIYGGDQQHAQGAKLLERYLLRELACLRLTDSDAIKRGQIKFSMDV